MDVGGCVGGREGVIWYEENTQTFLSQKETLLRLKVWLDLNIGIVNYENGRSSQGQ